MGGILSGAPVAPPPPRPKGAPDALAPGSWVRRPDEVVGSDEVAACDEVEVVVSLELSPVLSPEAHDEPNTIMTNKRSQARRGSAYLGVHPRTVATLLVGKRLGHGAARVKGLGPPYGVLVSATMPVSCAPFDPAPGPIPNCANAAQIPSSVDACWSSPS